MGLIGADTQTRKHVKYREHSHSLGHRTYNSVKIALAVIVSIKAYNFPLLYATVRCNMLLAAHRLRAINQ